MTTDTERVSLTLNLSKEILEVLDKLKAEYGARTRARVIEMLLQNLIGPEE